MNSTDSLGSNRLKGTDLDARLPNKRDADPGVSWHAEPLTELAPNPGRSCGGEKPGETAGLLETAAQPVPETAVGQAQGYPKPATTWRALYGFLLVSLAFAAYVGGVGLAPLRWLFLNPLPFREFNVALIWYSGIPLVAGSLLIGWELCTKVTRVRQAKAVRNDSPPNKFLTVALTAYNDERSIGGAVSDFLAHPLVRRVLVISNNSTDRTAEEAERAGAVVFNEPRQGYGACVHRALREALKFSDTELTVLCEGDLTFRAFDIDKLLAYIPHADVVNGSRIVEQLQNRDTQLSLYMHYGNLFAGKVLELKHLGTVSLTDVGTTYKLCRNAALRELLVRLDPRINLEFNAYFLDTALTHGVRILECPISFHPRVGASKGGNVNNRIATRLGLRMLWGIFVNWKGFGRG